MKVLKFGGTSVGSDEAIKSLIGIVKKELDNGERIVVVCSAMNNVTNSLLTMAKDAVNRNDFSISLQALEQQHYQSIRSLLDIKRQNPIFLSIKILLNELEEKLQGIKILNELSPRMSDSILAYGEQLSCMIIAAAVNQYFGRAAYVDARGLIVTDSAHGKATVQKELTEAKIKQWYASAGDAVPVVTGFIATDESGVTTTLGRGGSDYTAAILGAALNADRIEIWKDVDGFMTADPTLVKKAFTIPELGYDEAMELSYFGAKVIYPPAILPAVERRIPIAIKNTFNAGHSGSLIHNNCKPGEHLVKGISSVADACLINIEGGGMIGHQGFSGRLFSTIAAEGVNIILIVQASSEHSITLAIAPSDSKCTMKAIEREFRHELLDGKIEKPQIKHNVSILAAAGRNMRHTRGISGKIFSALGRNGVNVVAISQGSSEINISVVVERADLAKALNAVHDELFLSPAKDLHLFLAGTGNIGRELLKQLSDSAEYLQNECRLNIRLMGICNSRKMIVSREGELSPGNWEQHLKELGEQARIEEFIDHVRMFNLPNSVFIDNTASEPVVGQYEKLFSQNVSVVTCNKIGNSGPLPQYNRFRHLAKKHHVNFYYETNVGAGLPVIKTLRDLMVSGDKILKIEAVLSGTISYIFNSYTGDKSFADVVREAKDRGLTEPDPRNDLNGLDFARKVLILARETGRQAELGDVQVEPLLPEACLKAPSVNDFYRELEKAEAYFESLKRKAASENKVLRYIGLLDKDNLKISLTHAGNDHPFYNLSGSDNIISITTNRYKSNPLVIKGPGAGAAVTAAGVFADLVRISVN